MNTERTKVYTFNYANKITDFTMLQLYTYNQQEYIQMYDDKIFFFNI